MDKHQWKEGGTLFQAVPGRLLFYPNGGPLADEHPSDAPVCREILRLAEREAHMEKSRTSLAQALGAHGDATFGELIADAGIAAARANDLAEAYEGAKRRIAELEQEIEEAHSLGAELEARLDRMTMDRTKALVDRDSALAQLQLYRRPAEAAMRSACEPLWNEIHHLSGRLEKASEEIGRLKGELAVERERAESASGELNSCRQIINDAAQERLRLGEQTAILFNHAGQAEALVTKLRGRIEELERENYRLRDGVNRAETVAQEALVDCLPSRPLREIIDLLKAAAEGAHDPLVNGMKRAFLPGGDAIPEAPMEHAPAGGLAVDPEPRFSREELRAATAEYCSCGGHGPDDPGACPACLVWHALVRPEEG